MKTTMKDEALDRFVSLHPLLMETHAAMVSEWLPKTPPLSLLMSAYGRTLAENLLKLTSPEKESIFSAVEQMLTLGDDTLKDAVATCLLESFQGHLSALRLNPREISDLLGEKSRKYCREWDEFTGAQTPGL